MVSTGLTFYALNGDLIADTRSQLLVCPPGKVTLWILLTLNTHACIQCQV